jgi:hypothetical protein
MKVNLHLMKFCTFILSLLVIACQPKSDSVSESNSTKNEYLASYSKLPDNEAGVIIRKAIEGAGGWDAWTSKKALSYTKITTFYDSTGALSRTLRQLHEYNLFPTFQARISWEEKGKKYVMINNGQQAWKLEDGKEMTDEASKNAAWNSSFGSHYVMCMPFKLPDPGSHYEFEGKTVLPDGKEVNAIKVTYQKGAGSSALYHTWRYFFDPNTNELAANFLDFGNGYDYTQYIAFVTTDGIKLNQQRKSYKSDSLRQNIQLSSSYVNEEIQFKESFPADYFTISK